MSSKKQNPTKQNAPQKRKAEQTQQQQKAKQTQQQTQQPPKKKQAQDGGNNKPKQPKKQPEPEPEPEEEDEDEEGAEVSLGGFMGERDEAALAAIEKVQPEMDKITDSLTAMDNQMNAEIYAIQKKFLLKKRPILAKRDALLSGVKGLWKKLLSEHTIFESQLDQVDHEILDHLTSVEEEQVYSGDQAEKQQITGLTVFFTFTAGKHTKAGRYKKQFNFDEEKETLVCVPVKEKEQPFLNTAKFTTQFPDSFFLAWFKSDDIDEGIIAAQDALSSELLVDPLQLYRHLAEGNPMPNMDEDGSDDDDDAVNIFGEDGEEIDEDDEDEDEAPELVD